MSSNKQDTVAANWRVFVACGLISLSPFQYGVDFGLIGGLQAMPGFLEVCHLRITAFLPWLTNILRSMATDLQRVSSGGTLLHCDSN
jgi:hypothetical protein